MLTNGQHTLTTQPDHEDSYKHCVLVKLTDSSAKAIEEYLRNKDNPNKKPTIIFQRDKGEIIFPIEPSSIIKTSSSINLTTNGSRIQNKKFFFSLSGVKESNKDSSASFECISYSNSKLKTIGSIEQKLTVQANDEVFQATKERVTSVVEEEKKNSLLELKHSGAIVNRHSQSSTSNLSGMRSKQTPTSALNNSKLTPTVSAQISTKAPVVDRSLRERVIHLLALKPYNKPEILLRLARDGHLNEKEKETLESLIQSVGVINPRTAKYELTSDVMLNEVKEDWTFYNDSDRELVKRNISRVKQNLNSSLNTSGNGNLNNTSFNSSSSKSNSNNSSSTPYPTAANNKQSTFNTPPAPSFDNSSNFSHKSSLDEFRSANDSNKRISPYSNSNSHQSSSSTLNKYSPNVLKQQQYQKLNTQSHYSNVKHEQQTTGANANDLFNGNESKIDKNENFDLQQNSFKRLKTNSQTILPRPSEHVTLKKYHNEQSESNDLNEIQKIYKPIQSKQQLNEYKQEFDNHYKEYIELYNNIVPIAKQFEMHRKELNAITDHTSKDYEEKKKNIYNEYIEKKQDKEFWKKRERYHYLDYKLNFIQDLVKQYVSKQPS